MVIDKLISLLERSPGELQLYRIKMDGSRKIVVLSEDDWATIIEALRKTRDLVDKEI